MDNYRGCSSKFVELLSLFETDSQIVVAVYVCENVNNIPSETTFIQKNRKCVFWMV